MKNQIQDISPVLKGLIFEELTCKWRGVKNLNKEEDNYNVPIDHDSDPELGIIQTKGRSLTKNRWCFSSLEREHHKIFDHLICYCTDPFMKNIERIYIFPWEIVIKRKDITIYKYDIKLGGLYKRGWYEEYKLDSKIVEDVDLIYQNL